MTQRALGLVETKLQAWAKPGEGVLQGEERTGNVEMAMVGILGLHQGPAILKNMEMVRPTNRKYLQT